MTITVSANNGTAPADALSAMPGWNGDGTRQSAPHSTAQSYARLRAAMVAAGMGDLVPSSGWSCYRDRAAQQHMRDLGLTTIPVGQSIHGEWTYGSAVDFANLGGFGAARHEWLRANGAEFGWYQPGWAQVWGSLPEPWHWEHDRRQDPHDGEVVPPEPEPVPIPLEDDTMQLIRIVDDGRIMALGTYQWTQVPTMDDYNALSQAWGVYTEVHIGDAQRMHDQVIRNINDLNHSLGTTTTTTTTTTASRVALVALVFALAALVAFAVDVATDQGTAAYAAAGTLLGGVVALIAGAVRYAAGRHTAD